VSEALARGRLRFALLACSLAAAAAPAPADAAQRGAPEAIRAAGGARGAEPGGNFLAFGPENFARAPGKPTPVVRDFRVRSRDVPYTLRIENRGARRAIVRLNGDKVVRPRDLKRTVEVLERPVALLADNALVVDVRGKGALTLSIVGSDSDPPLVTITSPADGATLGEPRATLAGTATDAAAGVAQVTCNDAPASLSGDAFACEVPLDPGPNEVAVRATDLAGNVGAAAITVHVGGGVSPALSNLAAPATLRRGEDGVLAFDYADADSDVAVLETTQSNVFGERSGEIPAGLLGDLGKSGRATLPLPTADLPFGDTAFTLRLRDAGGRRSDPASFTLTIVGEATGGAPPVLSALSLPDSAWGRPRGPIDRLAPPFTIAWDDADADVFRVRMRVIDPSGRATLREGAAASYGIRGAAGAVEHPLLELRSTDPLGVYTVELTLFDRNGNSSDTAVARLELVAAGGRAPLAVTGFEPPGGPPGTEVTLTGEGFDTASLEANQVEIVDLRAEVLAVTSTSLSVRIPDGAVSQPFVVRNRHGAAASGASFAVPPEVRLSPVAPSLVVDETLAFGAEVVGTSARDLAWSVDGVDGGSSALGTIGPEGLYTAPPGIPPAGRVTIAAALASDPGIRGETELTILPPPLTLGSARVLASAGGKVHSAERRAAVDIPPGALPTDSEISVEVLQGSALPPPPSGQRLFGAVELGPSGLAFATPVTATVPLTRYVTPGSALTLRFLDATGAYRDEGIVATVGESGEQATAPISHFSTVVVLGPEVPSAPLAPPPAIARIEPAQGQEGTKVPVLIVGTGLGANLEVEVLRDGQPTSDVLAGTWYPLGGEGALLLDVQTIRDLPLGAARDYTVRLRRPEDGATAEASLTVLGLDELHVGALEPLPDPLQALYSEIEIEDLVVVSGENLALASTGPVSIDAHVDGRGARGEDGSVQLCGGLGGSDGEACGRAGPRDGRGGLGRDSGDDPEDKHFGGDAPIAFGRNGGSPRGVGGEPGSNILVTLGLDELAEAVVKCVEALVAGGLSPACAEVVKDAIEVAEQVSDLIEGPQGRRGFGSARSSDGGGGGGGGRLETPKFTVFEVAIPGIDLELSLDISFTHTGGGGGAGGRNGKLVSVVTPDVIAFGRDGGINVRGGDGGDGSERGVLQMLIHVPLIGGLLPELAISSGEVEGFAIAGGGGGGGAGGAVQLDSGTAVLGRMGSAGDHVDTRGGLGGRGGRTILENEVLGIRFERSEASEGAMGTLRVSAPNVAGNPPVFDPDTLETMVTNRSVLPVRVKAAGSDPILIRIESDAGPAREIEASFSNGFHVADVVVFSGFNTVCVAEPAQPCAASEMPALLQKRVLSVFVDTDGDGLSDVDEALLGTDPLDPDTDDDGLLDADEVARRTNPFDPDSDDDGLPDAGEIARGTSPANPDTDGDGASDGVEVVLGTDPTDAASRPTDVAPGTLFASSSGFGGGAFLTLVDAPTGAVGLLGRPNGGLGFGPAFDENGRLFVGAGSRLALHDPLADVTTDVGPFLDPAGAPVGITQLAANPTEGRLYGVEDGPAPDFSPTGQLVRIDRVSADVERVGNALASPILALAFQRDGRLYAALAAAPSDRLAELDPATGAVLQDIGPIGATPVSGLAFLRTGELVAAHRQAGDTSGLLVLDPSTASGAALSTVRRALFGLTVKPCPAPCLDQPPRIGIGTFGRQLALGDLDGDGDLDLVTPLAVFLNDGAGAFALRQFLGDGSRVVLGDLDADGTLDLVVAAVSFTSFEWTASVQLGLGGGFFGPAAPFVIAPSGVALSDLVLDDVTGDGALDLVAAAGAGAEVWRGDAAGGFAAPLVLVGGGSPGALATGDLDGDGAADVVAADETAAGTLSVHPSDGAGGFEPPATVAAFAAGTTPGPVALADLDRDTFLDIAVTSRDGNAVAVLYGDGTGAFPRRGEIALDADPLVRGDALAIGDLTGDATPDLAAADRGFAAGRSGVHVLVGDGAGGFFPAVSSPFEVIDFAFFVALGDLDGDGLLDVVAPGEGVTILLNHPAF
jgi:hypothetical protein